MSVGNQKQSAAPEAAAASSMQGRTSEAAASLQNQAPATGDTAKNPTPVWGDSLDEYEDVRPIEGADGEGVSPISLPDDENKDYPYGEPTDGDGDYPEGAFGAAYEADSAAADSAMAELNEVELQADLDELLAEFPELYSRGGELPLKSRRYGELRRLGLTAREAYLATAPRAPRHGARPTGAAPRPAHSPTSGMSGWEIKTARSLFSGLGDREIQRLYRKVTK